MPRPAPVEPTKQIQTRITLSAYAALTAEMYDAGFGRVADYLRHVIEAGLARRVAGMDRTIGTFGVRANALIAATIRAGAEPVQVALLRQQLSDLQRDLIRAGKP